MNEDEAREAAIRDDEIVKRYEEEVRDAMNGADDPFEWLFGPVGRERIARLAGARVRAAARLRRAEW